MRLWQLPPKYLDDSSLKDEHRNIRYILASNIKDSNFDDWAGYLVIQLLLCESELKVRKLSFDFIELTPADFTLRRTPSSKEVWESTQKLLESWEPKLLKPGYMDRYDIVNSKSAEDIWLENEWLIENIRREYGL